MTNLGIIEKPPDTTTTTTTSGSISMTMTALKNIITKPFRIGQMFHDMKLAGIDFSIDRDVFLERIMVVAEQAFAGSYAQNGYWSDHWTYTLDLIER